MQIKMQISCLCERGVSVFTVQGYYVVCTLHFFFYKAYNEVPIPVIASKGLDRLETLRFTYG